VGEVENTMDQRTVTFSGTLAKLDVKRFDVTGIIVYFANLVKQYSTLITKR
jgi:hypothetical protein